eukprot:COSAG05_NODE_1285_length_5279_cov_2.254633_2_plen_65_part_00
MAAFQWPGYRRGWWLEAAPHRRRHCCRGRLPSRALWEAECKEIARLCVSPRAEDIMHDSEEGCR